MMLVMIPMLTDAGDDDLVSVHLEGCINLEFWQTNLDGMCGKLVK